MPLQAKEMTHPGTLFEVFPAGYSCMDLKFWRSNIAFKYGISSGTSSILLRFGNASWIICQ